MVEQAEAGERWRTKTGLEFVVGEPDERGYVSAVGSVWHVTNVAHHFTRVAPTPKAGQRWSANDREIRIGCDGDTLMVIVPSSPLLSAVWTGDDASTGIASWLLVNGYSLVTEPAEKQSPSPAAPVSESPVELRDGLRMRSCSGAPVMLRSDDADGWTIEREDGTWAASTWSSKDVRGNISSGRWTVLDDTPTAPVAAQPSTPTWDRAASRKAIDAAVAKLRGEPFAKAVQAVLVAAAETRDLTTSEIEATIAACRAWEATRPALRELTANEKQACYAAARSAWTTACAEPWRNFRKALPAVYERARSRS